MLFLKGQDFEDVIRKGISLGGDSDTIACTAGAIAQAYFKDIPNEIAKKVGLRLPEALLNIIHQFNHRYGEPGR